jgi:sigma-B regulation protein RsbU (phosphoserine phosphatase)
VPFRRAGKIAGVATIDVRLEELQQWGRRSEIPGAVFTILSRQGRFISHPRPDYIMTETIFSAPTLEDRPDIQELGRRLLARDHGVELVRDFPLDEPSFLAHGVMPATGWTFMVALPEAEIMAPVVAQLRVFGLASLLSLLSILGIVFLVAVRITGPVRRLSADISRVGEGNLESPPTAGYPNDEIGLLATALSEMVGKLRSHVAALTRETAQREMVEGELRVARSIQASLIPQSFPAFPENTEFDLHALLQPARYMAGDFYDFFFTSDHELVLAVADVSGKGVPAAMLMAVTRTLMRTVVPGEPSPARVLRKLNDTLVKDNHEAYFVSMTLCFYDVRSGVLRYANAGHPPALRSPPGGKTEKACAGTGPVLGILEDVEYGEGEERLGPGETLVLFTDGVTEATAPGGDLYGYERFADLLASHSRLSPHELCETILGELDRFQAGNLADDLTLVALRRA